MSSRHCQADTSCGMFFKLLDSLLVLPYYPMKKREWEKAREHKSQRECESKREVESYPVPSLYPNLGLCVDSYFPPLS